jgi:hypothetical protein
VSSDQEIILKLPQLGIMGKIRKGKVVSAVFFKHITDIVFKMVNEVISEVVWEGLIFEEGDSTL